MKFFHKNIIVFIAGSILVMQGCKNDGTGTTEKSTESAQTADKKTNSNKFKDDNLAGFMLGGIYFIHGFGGINSVYENFVSAESGDATADELKKAYTEHLIYPFTSAQAFEVKNMLKDEWGVADKEGFLKNQTWLLKEGHQKEFEILLQALKGQAINGNVDTQTDISTIDIEKLNLGENKETLKKRLTYIKNNYTLFTPSGIKAWDLARYVNLVCLGYAAGYITKEDGNKMVAEALTVARAKYSDWSDYYQSYEHGRLYWGEDTGNSVIFASTIKEMLNGSKKTIFTYLLFK